MYSIFKKIAVLSVALMVSGGCCAMQQQQPLSEAEQLLFEGVSKRSPELVEKALRRDGANPNALDSAGHPPMYYAVEGQDVNLEVVKLLAQFGANVLYEYFTGTEGHVVYWGAAQSFLIEVYNRQQMQLRLQQQLPAFRLNAERQTQDRFVTRRVNSLGDVNIVGEHGNSLLD
jgi:hypothetical protein